MNSGTVHNHLTKKSDGQKRFYNRGSQPLAPFHNSQVVRLQTKKGHDKVGVVKRAADEPDLTSFMRMRYGWMEKKHFMRSTRC